MYAVLVFFGVGIVVFFKIVFHVQYKTAYILLCICIGLGINFYIEQKIVDTQQRYNSAFIFEHNTTQNIKGVIVDFPRYRFANNQYTLLIEDTQTYIQVFAHVHQKFEYLDILEISTRVQDVRNQDAKWHRYYQRLSVQYTALYPSKIVQSPHSPQTIEQYVKKKLFEFKKFVRQKSTKRFSSRTNALVLGMLFGEKDELSQDEKNIFNTAQLSHILVVSGYNVSLVITLLFFLMSSFHRYIRVVSTLGAIVLFVLLIGYESSVVRAGLMGCILVLARVIHRPGSAVNTLCIVAILMMLHNPLVLFDAGFHLSFIATYSLLIMPNIKKVPEYILSTIWIFLFVAPYILYMAGSVSFFGVINNIVILFSVPFFMLLSLGSLILSILNIQIGIDILILDIMSRYIFFVAHNTQNAPRISFELSSVHTILWYLILFGVIIFIQNRYTTLEYITKHYQKFQKQKTS